MQTHQTGEDLIEDNVRVWVCFQVIKRLLQNSRVFSLWVL